MKNKHAVALGRKGGKAGTGKAKARTTKQARSAAFMRWRNKAVKTMNNEIRAALIGKPEFASLKEFPDVFK